jgi:hypothetical protein
MDNVSTQTTSKGGSTPVVTPILSGDNNNKNKIK